MVASASTREFAALPSRPSRIIGRRLALGFGLVAAVVTAMCALLLAAIADISEVVSRMHDGEVAIRESLLLATASREQYLHQAHWLISRDDEHSSHSYLWRERVVEAVRTLGPLLPPSEMGRLNQLATDSRLLDELFRDSVQPAARSGDWETAVQGHESAREIADLAAAQADEIVRVVELGMAQRHASATRVAQAALIGGAACLILVLGLSIGFTVRLQRAVLQPLKRLTHVAREFGLGNLRPRAGNVGEGEFRALALTLDAMADELEAREKRVVESERMAAIGQLAAGVAHEINNPIAIIRGYLKTMDPKSSPEVLRAELRILDAEAASCQHIAEDLLAYACAPDLRCEVVQVDTVLSETVRRFSEASDLESVEIELRVEPGEAYADAGRIRQVVLNLMRNAMEAAAGTGPIEVAGSPTIGGGYGISVSDRGPGIPPEDRAKVFEPFFTKRSGGSGLGLAMCQGIVRAHGGTIAVEERKGGGCTVRVTLPSQPIVATETS